METVTNSAAAQWKVWEPFRRVCEEENVEPIESQIPWSAQWVPINVSDVGKFCDRKFEEGITPRTDETPTVGEFIEEGCIYPHVHDVLLDEVVTEYGDEMLGKCVEDMFIHIAQWTHRRGAKFAYLYAHNGVGFDSYVCLQFNRFPVKNLLKTSRGILSVSFTIDVGNEESIVIILRDTKVHMPGTLHSICKSFDVPKKWCKIDFPITCVNADNCYLNEVKKITKSYGENDVKCLAFIVKRINEMIMESDWNPAQLYNKPPIAQFLTCMSIVKSATRNHFIQQTSGGLNNILSHAIDLPFLRHWLTDATFGGRVNAYARTYLHANIKDIFQSYLNNDVNRLKNIHSEILENQSGMQVLDVTSLYPAAQALCPMPTGKLYYLSQSMCEEAVNVIECAACELMYSLCPQHKGEKGDKRPFAIILVRNCEPTKNDYNRCMTARKLHGTNNIEGLEYSLETTAELNKRFGKEKLYEIQSYSNVDLYWMKKQGYTFEIVGGFGWETSYIYQSFIEPAFQKRIEAKKAGNKVLSNSLKLMYNSTYGVTAQKDIIDCGFIMSTPVELQGVHHDDERVQIFVNSHHNMVNCDEDLSDSLLLRTGQTYFTKKKKEHLAEFFCEQSPIQIGCAVLAWARHIMNLIMFAFPMNGMQTYTDTDSIAISDTIIQEYLSNIPGLVNNASDGELGSLKNDHLEGPFGEPNGKEPRVVASFIGAKKVKMHITLNENGELKIFNTFKGLNPSNVHPVLKKRMHVDYGNKIVSNSLLSINEEGKMPDVLVSQWRRSLATGILIGEHDQTSSYKTYLGHSKGSFFYENVHGSLYEMLVPHGGYGEEYQYQAIKKGNGEITYQVEPANFHRVRRINSHCEYSMVKKVLDQYYRDSEKIYSIDTEEYRNIISFFEKL